ncbi:MAG TPA: ECF-type sigma factor [Xanthomonadales bacterium]|nr:ECF-type sigma factor [Xanthomonadales bacterium]
MQGGEFTDMLARYRAGEESAQGRLIALIHGDLRRLARRHLSGNRWIATLDTTALVNESYLRLVSPSAQHVETRAHFLNLASRVMRQIVVDFARRRLRERQRFERSGEMDPERLEAELAQARQFVALDEALADLARVDERKARVVDCRFFGGLSEDETAQALGIGLRTVQREWNAAREWLAEHMKEEEEEEDGEEK